MFFYFPLIPYFQKLKIPTASTATSLTLPFTSSGTWYLHLKDKAGNTNTVSKSLSYDVTPPSISVSVTNGTTPAKSKTATITVSDDSGLWDDAGVVLYKWSTEEITDCANANLNNGWTYLGIPTSGTSGSKTVTLDSLTGKGKMYVCPSDSEHDLLDNWNNEATISNTNPSSADMYLDNTPPVITVDGHTEDYTLSLTKDELSYETSFLGTYYSPVGILSRYSECNYEYMGNNIYIDSQYYNCSFNNYNYVYIAGSELSDGSYEDGLWRVVSTNDITETVKLIKETPIAIQESTVPWDGVTIEYNEVIYLLYALTEMSNDYFYTGGYDSTLFGFSKYLVLPTEEVIVNGIGDYFTTSSYYNLLTYNDTNYITNGYSNTDLYTTYIGQNYQNYIDAGISSGYLWHLDDLLYDPPAAPAYDFTTYDSSVGDIRPVILLSYDTPVYVGSSYAHAEGSYDDPHYINSTMPSIYAFPTGTVTDSMGNATITKDENVYPEWIDDEHPGTVTYTAKDAAGNTSTLNVTVYLRDESAPTATLAQTSNTSVTATITDDSVSGYYWSTTRPSSTSNISWTSTSSMSLTLPISSSSTYYFYVKDVSGNISPLYTITPDVSGPTVSLSQTSNTKVKATITDSSSITGYYWSMTKPSSTSSITWTSTTSKSLTLTASSYGTYYFYAKDKWGNISIEYTKNVQDIEPPTFSVSVSNGTTVKTSHTATVTISDSSGFAAPSPTLWYTWSTNSITICTDENYEWNAIRFSDANDGSTSHSQTLNITGAIGSGNGKLYVCYLPAGGNQYSLMDGNYNEADESITSANMYLSDDLTAPTVSLTQATGSTVTATITDASNVSAYYWGTTNYTSGSSVPSSSWTSSTSKSLTLSFTSSTTYYFYSKDQWGNISSKYSITPTYDVRAPYVGVSVSDGTTFSKSQSATIYLMDSNTITKGRAIYKWSEETISSCPTSTSGWTSVTFTTGSTYLSKSVTVSSGTGAGKIYVCPYPSSSYYPTDVYGNQATPSNTSPVSASMYLDNTSPEDCYDHGSNQTTWSTSHTIEMIFWDEHSGVDTSASNWAWNPVGCTSSVSACTGTNVSYTSAGTGLNASNAQFGYFDFDEDYGFTNYVYTWSRSLNSSGYRMLKFNIYDKAGNLTTCYSATYYVSAS